MKKFRLGISVTFLLLLLSYVYTIRRTYVEISNVTGRELQPLIEEHKNVLIQQLNKEFFEDSEETSDVGDDGEEVNNQSSKPSEELKSNLPPNPKNIPNVCDLSDVPEVKIGSAQVYDFFPMNRETEIGSNISVQVLTTQGFVTTKTISSFECKFHTGETSYAETYPNGYLWAALSSCNIPSLAAEALHSDSYIDFTVQWNTGSVELRVCYDQQTPTFYVSDCCIYRNDENIVEQWLQWNSMLGMDHFYMYDHLSTDNTNKLLQPFIDGGLVTYVNWRKYRPEPHNINTYHEAQDAMIISCLMRNRDYNKWIFMGDTDEFIYPIKENNFVYALEKYEDNENVDGVRIHGYMWIDDINNPLPLIEDPKKETTLVEREPLNMTFSQKYQYEWKSYETYKTFVKTHKPILSGLHNLNGMGKEYDYNEEELKFIHYRMERYGRPPSPGVYDPRPYERFGKKINL